LRGVVEWVVGKIYIKIELSRVMKQLIIICGFPGAEKTTLAKELEKNLPSSNFLDSDVLWKKHGTNFDPANVEPI
jgi:adenylylsulfate kinase-like enzyme